jgi:hypothetical protein
MNLFRKKYLSFILFIVAATAPVIIFLYEIKKIGGIRDIFDVDDENESI